MSVFSSVLHDFATANAQGLGSIQTKVPGVFNGVNGIDSPPANGRYLREIHIWTDNGVSGDVLNNIRVQDIDGIIPVPVQAAFPAYPVIQTLSETEPPEGNALAGVGIPVGQVLILRPIDPHDNRGFQFIPSGLYICADFHSVIGKTVRVNYIWGKNF